MRKPIEKIGSSILAHTHARHSIDGRVLPACGAYEKCKLQAELRVTTVRSRVTCPACRVAIGVRRVA